MLCAAFPENNNLHDARTTRLCSSLHVSGFAVILGCKVEGFVVSGRNFGIGSLSPKPFMACPGVLPEVSMYIQNMEVSRIRVPVLGSPNIVRHPSKEPLKGPYFRELPIYYILWLEVPVLYRRPVKTAEYVMYRHKGSAHGCIII